MKNMIDEIVFFGCSHSVINWKSYCKLPVSHTNHAESGSSNELILKKVKTYLNDNWDNLENKLLVIQFTYLHRKHVFFDLTQKEYKLNGISAINTNYGFSKENNQIVSQYYTDWLKYFYNSNYEFSNLLTELRLLKKILDLKGVKCIWYMWDDIQPEEIIDKEKDTNRLDIIHNIFDEIGFFKFDGEYTASEYTRKHKLRNCDILDTTDTHISEDNKSRFVEILKNKIDEFFL